MTTVGALPVLFGRTPSRMVQDMSLGFAAGVMLSASIFSLILPASDVAAQRYGDGTIAAAIVAAAILLGMGAFALTNELLLHEHFESGREESDAASLRRVRLFVVAIMIHNFPEGLAVGVGFAADRLETGLPLAIGIGIQNAPEGLAVAVILLGENYSKWRAFGIAAMTGLVEPVGGLLGVVVINVSQLLLPWCLAFSAGAMIYVISHEIIPETFRSGHKNQATIGLAIGLVRMLFLDVWLG